MSNIPNIENISNQNTFKRLLLYTKPHLKKLSFAFAILLLATGADVLGPIIIKIFIDDYLTPRIFEWKPITLLATTYLTLLITSVTLNYFQLLTFNKTALWIIHQLRVDVFSKVQHLGLSFFDKSPGGSLVSRITNDTEAIKELYVSVLSTFVQNIVFLVGVLIAMLFLNPKLAGLFFLLLPVILLLMKIYRHLSSKIFHLTRKKLSELNSKLNESLQGMNIIQAMRQENRFKKEFGNINQQHYSSKLKQIKINGLLTRPAIDLVYMMALSLILSFFGIKSLNSTIEIGVVYAFINYLDRFFEPINMMMFRLSQFQQALVAAERVFGLLDEKDLAPSKEGEGRPTITEGLIEFRNVTFSYDGKTNVLKNISFTAKPGETVALVGHTGSGKSSIVNLLMRFYPIKYGEILIDGIPLQNFSNEELRQKIGLVLQDPFLFVGNIKENIRLHNKKITDQDVIEAAKFVQADSFIQRLPNNYEEAVYERGATFSSGQRQLISFARTMAIKPKILVLDEATASIDTETEELIQTTLKKMRTGRTTIAIAHRLSTIQDADLIIVLHKGKIVESGNHQELLAKKGLYHNMYILQQGITDSITS
ncbi:multidrug ABC transporter ATP-binding protein [Vulcanibacillus modesticaldus]|uniref:Multidrug ABC transporter ATP-binding protein n=1 Tax=Vulcanibacillus modesticaldus TaxID=337097 RepID=A0A1D2YUF3_9BACI|nr:ABC transporter transmembrane domain-containing protein [Vulcanibacillus modesticaldus]OEF99334.1 multidrug ABC transporter ATP-binding protein [Vulcanibacillus modesticaldus]